MFRKHVTPSSFETPRSTGQMTLSHEGVWTTGGYSPAVSSQALCGASYETRAGILSATDRIFMF
jgi:hypothetical protein